MQANNDYLHKPIVLVRAWGDEPVKLNLHRIENNRCFVAAAGALRPIGLPLNQVFVFDLDRFSTLSTAYESSDFGKLGELWANIPVDDLACNRYQDMLRCVHDQENLTDSECATRGNTQ